MMGKEFVLLTRGELTDASHLAWRSKASVVSGQQTA